MGVYPSGAILPQGASDLLTGAFPHIWVTDSTGASQYYLSGPQAPWPGIQDGIILKGGIKGLSPAFKHIDLKSARQPGVTWTGTVYDILEITMSLEAHATTPSRLSGVVSEWMGIWDPTQLLTLEYITNDHGYWYIPARLSKTWPDTWQWTRRTFRPLTQTIRCDSGFWFGMPHIDSFTGSGTGFLGMVNIGSEPAWPSLLITGPGTFTWSNGPSANTTTQISLGPLEAGQKVLVSTNPRSRGVIDLSGGTSTTQALTVPEKLLEQLINFVTNNNVPPLLQHFESKFGVYPPQGPLYSLLSGIYSNPFPGVATPSMATLDYLKVTVTGGSGSSSVVGRIDPQRRWPE